jgi:hypothetical protein
VSEEIRAAVTAWAPALSTSVEPAPIDTRRAPDRARARRMLRLDTTRLIVIVGRLVRSKRVDVALRSAALVPKANVVVIGDGPEAAELAAEHPGVRFVGLVPRDQALTWIAAADLVLSASRSEGAPTVIREAPRAGRAGGEHGRRRLDPVDALGPRALGGGLKVCRKSPGQGRRSRPTPPALRVSRSASRGVGPQEFTSLARGGACLPD